MFTGVVCALVMATPGLAGAHATLVSSVPADDSRVAISPSQVVLTFDENISVGADATRRHLLVGSYDAAMMASMVVMSVLMSAPATVSSGSAEANSAQGSMPGMGSMSGMGVPGTAGWAQPTGVAVLAALCAAAYFAAALWWFYALIRGPARPWGEVLMATGMGVAFAVLM